MQNGYRGVLPEEITTRQKGAFQDGMGIKNEFEKVLDKPPVVWYSNSYSQQFGL